MGHLASGPGRKLGGDAEVPSHMLASLSSPPSWVLLASVDKHLGRHHVPGEPSVTTPQGCSRMFLRARVLLLFKQFVSFIYKCFTFSTSARVVRADTGLFSSAYTSVRTLSSSACRFLSLLQRGGAGFHWLLTSLHETGAPYATSALFRPSPTRDRRSGVICALEQGPQSVLRSPPSSYDCFSCTNLPDSWPQRPVAGAWYSFGSLLLESPMRGLSEEAEAEAGRPEPGSPEVLPGSSRSNKAGDSWHLLSTDSRRFGESP